MNKVIVKVLLGFISTIIIAVNGYALTSIIQMKSDLPITYISKADASKDRDLVIKRLERMEKRIITRITKLDERLYDLTR